MQIPRFSYKTFLDLSRSHHQVLRSVHRWRAQSATLGPKVRKMGEKGVRHLRASRLWTLIKPTKKKDRIPLILFLRCWYGRSKYQKSKNCMAAMSKGIGCAAVTWLDLTNRLPFIPQMPSRYQGNCGRKTTESPRWDSPFEENPEWSWNNGPTEIDGQILNEKEKWKESVLTWTVRWWQSFCSR